MNKLDLISVRDYRPEDKNFILATWLRGLFYGNDWFNLIEKDTYFRFYQAIIERILDRTSVNVKVACLKDDEDVILAYAVIEGPILHWVQTKSAWRNIKLATLIVPKETTTVTHLTKVGRTLLTRKKLTFNPFAI